MQTSTGNPTPTSTAGAAPDASFDARYRAVASRDRRFDGRFYTAVTSTGIYCRPICPARTPGRDRVRFYVHAAGAEAAGFRACRRCRPDLGPGSPEWDVAGDLVRRGLRLIAAGVVDRDGVAGLAQRLHVSERHLHRVFVDEVGSGPLRVARSRRARLARQLLDSSAMKVTDVAFATGFRSVRTFNATFREVYGATPSELRSRRVVAAAGGGSLRLRLATRHPFDHLRLLEFLSQRTSEGVDRVVDGRYERWLPGRDGPVLLGATCEPDAVLVDLDGDPRDGLAAAVDGVRQLFDVDADPAGWMGVLSEDPALRRVVAERPGLRLMGTFDPWEGAARVLLGQQVSVAAARTLAGRLVALAGGHGFPSAQIVASADLDRLGMPTSRIRALRALAVAVASEEVVLDGAMPFADARAALLAVPGIGPWTVEVIAMRVLRDPDAFPVTDLGVRHAAVALGLPDDERGLLARAEAWRPWRAYAVQHLWTHLAEQDTP